ncbi:MAG: LysE family translocator [Epsilonproteobacteria bacterium]|nr:LysE family translocator [Campylobacterota bacterium]
MLHSFIEGFLLGMGAAVPIGAINILIMNHALKSYKSAVVIGFGAMSADIVYLIGILLGLATFLKNPTVSIALGLLGSLFLAYMALMIFKGRNSSLDKADKIVSNRHLIKHYFQGFVLTFINPYTIAFWLSIAGYTVNQELHPAMTMIGMLCAILLWITLMPYFVHRSKHKISAKVSYYISIGSTLLLGFFALSLLVNVLRGL